MRFGEDEEEAEEEEEAAEDGVEVPCVQRAEYKHGEACIVTGDLLPDIFRIC
jgi:hypothetical protein